VFSVIRKATTDPTEERVHADRSGYHDARRGYYTLADSTAHCSAKRQQPAWHSHSPRE